MVKYIGFVLLFLSVALIANSSPVNDHKRTKRAAEAIAKAEALNPFASFAAVLPELAKGSFGSFGGGKSDYGKASFGLGSIVEGLGPVLGGVLKPTLNSVGGALDKTGVFLDKGLIGTAAYLTNIFGGVLPGVGKGVENLLGAGKGGFKGFPGFSQYISAFGTGAGGAGAGALGAGPAGGEASFAESGAKSIASASNGIPLSTLVELLQNSAKVNTARTESRAESHADSRAESRTEVRG